MHSQLSKKRTVHLIISGRVQGVGFRWFVAEHAQRLGLAGWVKNLPSGEVEVMTRGDDAAVAELEGVIAKGPPGARVDLVTKLRPTNEGELNEKFEIAR